MQEKLQSEISENTGRFPSNFQNTKKLSLCRWIHEKVVGRRFSGLDSLGALFENTKFVPARIFTALVHFQILVDFF